MIKTLCNIDEMALFIELLPDLAFVKNRDGEYLCCNALFLEFVDKSREEVIGKTDFDLFSSQDATVYQRDEKNILEENSSCCFDETIQTKDAHKLYYHVSKQIIYDANKNQVGLFSIARNVTLEKQYQIIYDDNRLLLEYIAVHSNLHISLEKIVLYAEKRNENAICSILLLDKAKERLFTGAAPNLPDFYNEAMNGVLIGEKIGSCGSAASKQERVIVQNIDSHENWQDYLTLTNKANLHSCWSEPIFSSKKEILGTFAIYHSSAKKPTAFELKLIKSYAHLASVAIEKNLYEETLKEKERQILEQTKSLNEALQEHTKNIEEKNILLKNMISKDYLTGLYNRIKLDDTLEDELKLSKQYNSLFGVIMIDIDFFKRVNDEHGHQVGDTTLKEFSKILIKYSRETDIIGRWGGEEFLIILKNINAAHLTQVAEKLRESVQSHTFPVITHVTASFGLTLCTKDDTLNTLVDRADKALYLAKNSGRNCAKFL